MVGAESGWHGARSLAAAVAFTFCREERFWTVVAECRRGELSPIDGARRLVPLQRRSVRVVARYIDVAALLLDDDQEKRDVVALELANLGINVWDPRTPNPYGRKYWPRGDDSERALELLERILAKQCAGCGKHLAMARGRKRLYCEPCDQRNAKLRERDIPDDGELNWRRVRRLLQTAELVVGKFDERDPQTSAQKPVQRSMPLIRLAGYIRVVGTIPPATLPGHE